MSLINCEIKLILTWSKNCVLADMTRRNARGSNPSIIPSKGLEFQIADTKLYLPVVTLSEKTWFLRVFKFPHKMLGPPISGSPSFQKILNIPPP